MQLSIRNIETRDVNAVLELNDAAGQSISPLTLPQLRGLEAIAAYFRVAEIDGRIAGFLIAVPARAQYDNTNFLWFKKNRDGFVYIDRIVVAKQHRGHGLGRVFYADVESFAEVRSPILACDVSLEPRDDISVLFHGTYGFREVGQQALPNGRRSSLLIKELCSYEWIHARYFSSSGSSLPDVPWLAERARLDPA